MTDSLESNPNSGTAEGEESLGAEAVSAGTSAGPRSGVSMKSQDAAAADDHAGSNAVETRGPQPQAQEAPLEEAQFSSLLPDVVKQVKDSIKADFDNKEQATVPGERRWIPAPLVGKPVLEKLDGVFVCPPLDNNGDTLEQEIETHSAGQYGKRLYLVHGPEFSGRFMAAVKIARMLSDSSKDKAIRNCDSSIPLEEFSDEEAIEENTIYLLRVSLSAVVDQIAKGGFTSRIFQALHKRTSFLILVSQAKYDGKIEITNGWVIRLKAWDDEKMRLVFRHHIQWYSGESSRTMMPERIRSRIGDIEDRLIAARPPLLLGPVQVDRFCYRACGLPALSKLEPQDINQRLLDLAEDTGRHDVATDVQWFRSLPLHVRLFGLLLGLFEGRLRRWHVENLFDIVARQLRREGLSLPDPREVGYAELYKDLGVIASDIGWEFTRERLPTVLQQEIESHRHLLEVLIDHTDSLLNWTLGAADKDGDGMAVARRLPEEDADGERLAAHVGELIARLTRPDPVKRTQRLQDLSSSWNSLHRCMAAAALAGSARIDREFEATDGLVEMLRRWAAMDAPSDQPLPAQQWRQMHATAMAIPMLLRTLAQTSNSLASPFVESLQTIAFSLVQRPKVWFHSILSDMQAMADRERSAGRDPDFPRARVLVLIKLLDETDFRTLEQINFRLDMPGFLEHNIGDDLARARTAITQYVQAVADMLDQVAQTRPEVGITWLKGLLSAGRELMDCAETQDSGRFTVRVCRRAITQLLDWLMRNRQAAALSPDQFNCYLALLPAVIEMDDHLTNYALVRMGTLAARLLDTHEPPPDSQEQTRSAPVLEDDQTSQLPKQMVQRLLDAAMCVRAEARRWLANELVLTWLKNPCKWLQDAARRIITRCRVLDGLLLDLPAGRGIAVILDTVGEADVNHISARLGHKVYHYLQPIADLHVLQLGRARPLGGPQAPPTEATLYPPHEMPRIIQPLLELLPARSLHAAAAVVWADPQVQRDSQRQARREQVPVRLVDLDDGVPNSCTSPPLVLQVSGSLKEDDNPNQAYKNLGRTTRIIEELLIPSLERPMARSLDEQKLDLRRRQIGPRLGLEEGASPQDVAKALTDSVERLLQAENELDGARLLLCAVQNLSLTDTALAVQVLSRWSDPSCGPASCSLARAGVIAICRLHAALHDTPPQLESHAALLELGMCITRLSDPEEALILFFRLVLQLAVDQRWAAQITRTGPDNDVLKAIQSLRSASLLDRLRDMLQEHRKEAGKENGGVLGVIDWLLSRIELARLRTKDLPPDKEVGLVLVVASKTSIRDFAATVKLFTQKMDSSLARPIVFRAGVPGILADSRNIDGASLAALNSPTSYDPPALAAPLLEQLQSRTIQYMVILADQDLHDADDLPWLWQSVPVGVLCWKTSRRARPVTDGWNLPKSRGRLHRIDPAEHPSNDILAGAIADQLRILTTGSPT